MDAGLSSVVSSYQALRNQNLIENVQAGLLRKSIDHQTQTMTRLLEAVPVEKSNPPHLGKNIDVTA